MSEPADQDRRKKGRRPVSISAVMKDGLGSSCRGTITDISENGCSIRIEAGVPTSERHNNLKFAGLEGQAVFTAWEKGRMAGMAFLRPLYSPLIDELARRFPPPDEHA